MDEEQVHNYPKSLHFDTRPEQAMPNGNLPLPNQKRGAEPHIANQEAAKEGTDDEELEMGKVSIIWCGIKRNHIFQTAPTFPRSPRGCLSFPSLHVLARSHWDVSALLEDLCVATITLCNPQVSPALLWVGHCQSGLL